MVPRKFYPQSNAQQLSLFEEAAVYEAGENEVEEVGIGEPIAVLQKDTIFVNWQFTNWLPFCKERLR